MHSTFYADEYGLVDVTYLVHAFPFNPCAEHEEDAHVWCIGLLFHIGTKAQRSTLTYPTRAHRDQALEALCAHATAVAAERA